MDSNKHIFTENLNYYLEKSGKTQLEIAEAIGVSPQTFNTWVKGIAIPRMGKLQKLADYFNISKSDLIENKCLTSDTAILQVELLERQDILELNKKLMLQPEEIVQQVSDYADFIIAKK